MHKPEVLLGTPLNFQNKIFIYPPTVKEVVTNSNFGAYYKILTMTSDDIKDELREKISP